MSNGCAHCGALIGEFFEHEAWDDQKEVANFRIRITDRWRRAIEDAGYDAGWGVYPAE